jgi:hypothetical protein
MAPTNRTACNTPVAVRRHRTAAAGGHRRGLAVGWCSQLLRFPKNTTNNTCFRWQQSGPSNFPMCPSSPPALLGEWIRCQAGENGWLAGKKWEFRERWRRAGALGLTSRRPSPPAQITPSGAVGLRSGHPTETKRPGRHLQRPDRRCLLFRPVVGHEASRLVDRNKNEAKQAPQLPWSRGQTGVQGGTKANGSDGTGVRGESCHRTSSMLQCRSPLAAPCDCRRKGINKFFTERVLLKSPSAMEASAVVKDGLQMLPGARRARI